MKKVYAVTMGRDYDFEMAGVFSTLKRAQAFVDKKLAKMKKENEASAPQYSHDNGFDSATIDEWVINDESYIG